MVRCVGMASSASASPSIASAPFLLLFRNAGEETHRHLTPDEREALTRRWNDWYASLAAQGKVREAKPLALSGRVVEGVRGERVTDGPFAEAKEAVGGFFIIHAADLDEATRIAQGCPGLPIGLSVEVRAILTHSPVLDRVRGHGVPE